ncbi:sporulation protein Cse60 [Saccharibacillus sacchari]|uniref:Sporulation protein Cse60 n=1 Tax=Saccharibacillus sacchari TaxID=456493 RepID=A0ACC6PI53_9BACL
MQYVEYIEASNAPDLQKEVNSFLQRLEGREVIDIKFDVIEFGGGYRNYCAQVQYGNKPNNIGRNPVR